MTNKPQKLFALVLGIALILTVTPASASEIWVAPAEEAPEKKIGNWPVSKKGDTHFSFAIPDDMKAFVAAKVVVIGKKDKDFLYDLSLSIAQNEQRHDEFNDDTFQQLPASVDKDELLEIDVSSPFLDLDFFPGEDYVALHFKADKKGDVRVLGLRFTYDTEVFFDNTTGNIGIGTTTPDSELEVKGTVAASAFASTSPLVFEAPAGTERMRIDDISGDLSVGGTAVINSSGQWVGDPTGLAGPPGADGATGPQGPAGPGELEGAITNVTVDCGIPGESIGAALANAEPGGHLHITVVGTCAENITIDRDRVTLAAQTAQVDGVTGLGGGDAITVAGAREVVIDGLRIQSSLPLVNSPSGVFVTRNGAVTIIDALIENNVNGVFATHGGFVRINDSQIIDNRDYGLLLTDGGAARADRVTIIVNNSAKSDDAAIGAFRSNNIRLRGDNLIANYGNDGTPGTADDGYSLWLFHNVEFRQDGGHTVYVGEIEVGNRVHASLRDPEIVGVPGVDIIHLSGHSLMDIRNASNGAKVVTGGGDIDVFGYSSLSFTHPGEVIEVGAIDLNRYASLSVSNGGNLTASGNFLAFGRSSVDVGDGSVFNVQGNTSMGPFAEWNMGANSEFNGTGQISFFGFNQMFADSGATLIGDLNFGSNANVNMFGDNVSYTGNMNFGQGDFLSFGLDATIDGIIDCGGGGVGVTNSPTFLSGGFVNCFVSTSTVDLGISTSDSPDPVTLTSGDPVVYTHVVESFETVGFANNTLVIGTISGSPILGAISTTQGSCNSPAPGSFTCELGGLQGGDAATITVNVTPTVTGELTSTVNVESDETDPNPANNSFIELTQVN